MSEKMAFNAAVLPMLISDSTIVKHSETRSAFVGMSRGNTVGASHLEKGRPLLRAKAQSCRGALATTAIALAVRLMIMITVMISVAARDLVAL